MNDIITCSPPNEARGKGEHGPSGSRDSRETEPIIVVEWVEWKMRLTRLLNVRIQVLSVHTVLLLITMLMVCSNVFMIRFMPTSKFFMFDTGESPYETKQLQLTSHLLEPWVLTFVGDTMIRPPKDKPDNWTYHKPFSKIKHLLKKSDYVIGNLEGPITTLDSGHDPLHRRKWYSFNVDPAVAAALKRVGFSAACLANNHFNDRGSGGIRDTLRYLKETGIQSFGLGTTPRKAAKPLLIETPMGVTIGVTGMSQLYSFGKSLGDGDMGVIQPEDKDSAALAVELQRASGADVKVAFVHWGWNYVMDPKNDKLDKYAAILADAGFNLIIGSDGSHTAQIFEYVHGVPVLYNIGNFAFLTPGKFSREEKDEYGDKLLPYGMVVHALLDKSGKFSALELHCLFVDNSSNDFATRPCMQEEAKELFLSLGPHVELVPGDVHATIRLRERQNVDVQVQ